MTASATLEAPARVCRECGCSDLDACVVTEAPELACNQPGQPCWWVDVDLCSACTERVDPRLAWHHGGNTTAPLTRKEKAAFTWVAFTIALALTHLAGFIG